MKTLHVLNRYKISWFDVIVSIISPRHQTKSAQSGREAPSGPYQEVQLLLILRHDKHEIAPQDQQLRLQACRLLVTGVVSPVPLDQTTMAPIIQRYNWRRLER